MRSKHPTLTLSLQAHNEPGKLITFSGVDGSGKTTLANATVDRIKRSGRNAHLLALLAPEIVMLEAFRDYDQDPVRSVGRSVDMLALSVVCSGMRLLNVRTKVMPLLKMGHWVVCDRYAFTSLAEIQAFDVPPRDKEVLDSVLNLFPKPDLAILALAKPETCIRRILLRASERGKQLDVQHYTRLVSSFREVAIANGLKTIPTDQDQPSSEALVFEQIEQLMR